MSYICMKYVSGCLNVRIHCTVRKQKGYGKLDVAMVCNSGYIILEVSCVLAIFIQSECPLRAIILPLFIMTLCRIGSWDRVTALLSPRYIEQGNNLDTDFSSLLMYQDIRHVYAHQIGHQKLNSCCERL